MNRASLRHVTGLALPGLLVTLFLPGTVAAQGPDPSWETFIAAGSTDRRTSIETRCFIQ